MTAVEDHNPIGTFFFTAVIISAVFLPSLAMAADATIIATDLPSVPGSVPVYGEGGKGPVAIIYNFYLLMLATGGVLAFAVLLKAAIKYYASGGSHSALSDAKADGIGAFLGLLMLGGGAYLGLQTINPDLTFLRLPFLEPLRKPEAFEGPPNVTIPGAIPGNDWGCVLRIAGKEETKKCYPNFEACKADCKNQLDTAEAAGAVVSGDALCQVSNACRAASVGESGNCRAHRLKYPGSQCVESEGVKEVVACVRDAGGPAPSATIGGTHNIDSCHFGGRLCTDGGHAIDYGINGSAPKTLREVSSMVATCASTTQNTVNCFYENSNPDPDKGETIRKDGSGVYYASTDPRVDHLHCNVNAASCGCS